MLLSCNHVPVRASTLISSLLLLLRRRVSSGSRTHGEAEEASTNLLCRVAKRAIKERGICSLTFARRFAFMMGDEVMNKAFVSRPASSTFFPCLGLLFVLVLMLPRTGKGGNLRCLTARPHSPHYDHHGQTCHMGAKEARQAHEP